MGSAFVHMYAKCGSIEDAAVVFDKMKEWNIITWNVMIGTYARSDRGVKAYDLYVKMKEEGFQPNAVSHMCLLNECANTRALDWVKGVYRHISKERHESDVRMRALEWVKDMHRHILEGGHESDLRMGRAFVHIYAKRRSIEDVVVVSNKMKERDIITWNVMIGAYAGSDRGVEACDLYVKMKEEGFQPNAVTYMSSLNDCANTGALEWMKEVHRHILEEGHESNIHMRALEWVSLNTLIFCNCSWDYVRIISKHKNGHVMLLEICIYCLLINVYGVVFKEV